ncbi:hypothetical protein [Kitasatospora cineracea]|uniref:Excreted virulence factor EspC (Type VII ESX diderm) n=1 Tax=Kitasatospora cineracea TaxID=88074 RepID=A0A3N4RNE7_9ACTN|nr:hypothetical protein [Kitasatospora cineracea]RPE34948.1 hypothetical protein EDD38_3291 [Kitasatospora cineracea]
MTADQLTVLVDRACRGVASAVEAEQLRASIAQLQQQAAKAADLHDRLAEVAKIADRFEAQPGYGGYYDAAMDAAISIREALQ